LALDSSSFIVSANTDKLVSSANNLIFPPGTESRRWKKNKRRPRLILEGLHRKLTAYWKYDYLQMYIAFLLLR